MVINSNKDFIMLNSLKLKTTNLQSAPFDCNGNVVQIANTLLALIKICT